SGARVQVRAQATQATRSALTDDNGLFEFVNLQPGVYTLEVTAGGFAPAQRAVTPEGGERMPGDIVPSLGEESETIEITGTAPILKTQDVSLGEVVEPKSIADLPLNGRMLVDLALTVPGAHASHGAQTGDMNPLCWRPGQRSAISIGGNR